MVTLQKFSNSPLPRINNQPATGQPSESGLQSVHTPSTQEETKGEAATVACGNQVLMQTASTTALNTSGDQSIPVRMILDSGSKRTYIIS